MRLLSNFVDLRKICRLKKFQFSTNRAKLKPPWDVLFFGTDEFSVTSLQALTREKSGALINRLEVVTSAKNNVVRKYAEKNDLVIHSWPLSAPPPRDFDVGLVVSFGHLLPREVIYSFPMGMLNVHASLLPRWRGAAPIIYALMHGDSRTGVSIMRVRPEKFDVGEIVRQQEVEIGEQVRLPELHGELAQIGAENLVRTLGELPDALAQAVVQGSEGVTFAPRVNASVAVVDFTRPAKDVYNLSRALHGLFPLSTSWNGVPVKLHNVVSYENFVTSTPQGTVQYLKTSKVLVVHCSDGCVHVDRIGVQNKRIMNATEFNNGFLKKQPVNCRVFR